MIPIATGAPQGFSPNEADCTPSPPIHLQLLSQMEDDLIYSNMHTGYMHDNNLIDSLWITTRSLLHNNSMMIVLAGGGEHAHQACFLGNDINITAKKGWDSHKYELRKSHGDLVSNHNTHDII